MPSSGSSALRRGATGLPSPKIGRPGCNSVQDGDQVIISAILINILNPKLSIFFLAFLPQFIRTDELLPLPRMFMLSVIFMLLTFVVFAGYGLFAASIRSHVISRPRALTWMRRTFAAGFAALGIKLALADR